MSVKKAPIIRLPKSWTSHVRSAMLHVISLAQFATVYTRSWAVDSVNARVRLKSENCRLRQEFALLQEEIRIKDGRMAQIGPQRRPYYPPAERMAILELRATRSWTLQQAADTFLLTAPTIASWMKRLDEEGPDALVQLREPVNKFPDFVRYAVQLSTLPNEVYFERKPVQRRPRIEPRPRWPRPSPCAKQQTLVGGQPGDQFELHIKLFRRRRHLPIVELPRVA